MPIALPPLENQYTGLGAGLVKVSGTNVVLASAGTDYLAPSAVISISHGGTGQTTQNAAANAILPSQASASGKYLTSDGKDSSWGTVSATPGGSSGQLQWNSTSAFAGAQITYGADTLTNAITTFLSLTPTVNQSSTAAYTALKLNVTETATGSGAKLLCDFQVAGVSKFKVDDTGVTTIAGTGSALSLTTAGVIACDYISGNTGLFYSGDAVTGVAFSTNTALLRGYGQGGTTPAVTIRSHNAFSGATSVVCDVRNGATIRMEVWAGGSIILSPNGALATSATDGFTYLPSCAGPPTGVPTSKTGNIPMVVDSTNSKLYMYIGGAWKSVTLA